MIMLYSSYDINKCKTKNAMKLKLLLFKRRTFLWQYCILVTLSYSYINKLKGSVNSGSPFSTINFHRNRAPWIFS